MQTPRLDQLFNFLKDNPTDAFIQFAIAKEYEGLGELEKALEYYRKLEESNKEYVGTYYHLGKLLEQLDAPTEAFATYKKGMSIAKAQGDQHSLSELAGAKLSLGDDEDFEVDV